MALFRLIVRLHDSLGDDQFNVLGTSWGGVLANQLAFPIPRRCRRLVLVVAATGWLMVPARPGVLLRMATPLRYRDAGYARAIAAELYGGRMRSRPDLVQRLILDF